jgi:hypothetical protein
MLFPRVLTILGVITLAGCSATVAAPSAATDTTAAEVYCERTGGWWRPQLGFCEYQEYDRIFGRWP